MAASSTDGGDESWVEVADAPVEERDAWAPRGVCDRMTAWAPKWAMPAMMALAACGVEPELPAADEVVQVYDARTGDWSEGAGAELEVGDTWLDDGRLHRWTDDRVEDRGVATVEDLAVADATWTAEAATGVPGTDAWVLVLGEADAAGHWKLGAVEAGDRFAFQGRVFETADADNDGLVEVRPTGDVLGRVYQTHVRQSDVVIDLVVTGHDGSETITGTPEHPFWVPEVGDYVAMGDLEVGTVLRTVGGGEARVASIDWREGDFEVFNFEVEDAHNYYVRAPGGGGDGVLVHNGCGPLGMESAVGSIDEMSAAASAPARRAGPRKAGLSVSGDMLQKHAARGDETYSGMVTGTKSGDINDAAQDLVDDLLTDPGGLATDLGRGGVEVTVPGRAQAARWNADGSFDTFTTSNAP